MEFIEVITELLTNLRIVAITEEGHARDNNIHNAGPALTLGDLVHLIRLGV